MGQSKTKITCGKWYNRYRLHAATNSIIFLKGHKWRNSSKLRRFLYRNWDRLFPFHYTLPVYGSHIFNFHSLLYRTVSTLVHTWVAAWTTESWLKPMDMLGFSTQFIASKNHLCFQFRGRHLWFQFIFSSSYKLGATVTRAAGACWFIWWWFVSQNMFPAG